MSSFALCSLNQRFPNYVPRNTGIPRDRNRYSAKKNRETQKKKIIDRLLNFNLAYLTIV